MLTGAGRRTSVVESAAPIDNAAVAVAQRADADSEAKAAVVADAAATANAKKDEMARVAPDERAPHAKEATRVAEPHHAASESPMASQLHVSPSKVVDPNEKSSPKSSTKEKDVAALETATCPWCDTILAYDQKYACSHNSCTYHWCSHDCYNKSHQPISDGGHSPLDVSDMAVPDDSQWFNDDDEVTCYVCDKVATSSCSGCDENAYLCDNAKCYEKVHKLLGPGEREQHCLCPLGSLGGHECCACEFRGCTSDAATEHCSVCDVVLNTECMAKLHSTLRVEHEDYITDSLQKDNKRHKAANPEAPSLTGRPGAC